MLNYQKYIGVMLICIVLFYAKLSEASELESNPCQFFGVSICFSAPDNIPVRQIKSVDFTLHDINFKENIKIRIYEGFAPRNAFYTNLLEEYAVPSGNIKVFGLDKKLHSSFEIFYERNDLPWDYIVHIIVQNPTADLKNYKIVKKFLKQIKYCQSEHYTRICEKKPILKIIYMKKDSKN